MILRNIMVLIIPCMSFIALLFGCDCDDEQISIVKVEVITRNRTIEVPDDDLSDSVTVRPSEEVIIKTTTDYEGDYEIECLYKANGGKIDGKGNSVKWIAPEKEERYFIIITIRCGGSSKVMDEWKVNIKVDICPTPLNLEAPITVTDYYVPSGWMGDGEQGLEYISVDEAYEDDFHSEPSCTKWAYEKGPIGWAAVAYQYPEGNWGKCKGNNIKGAKRLTFWAKGENGGENIDFKIGSLDSRPYNDSLYVSKKITLEAKWIKYTLNIERENTSNVITGFLWATNQSVTFYLDDIVIEQ